MPTVTNHIAPLLLVFGAFHVHAQDTIIKVPQGSGVFPTVGQFDCQEEFGSGRYCAADYECSEGQGELWGDLANHNGRRAIGADSLGVHLDQGNDWHTIALRVREAYAHVAPNALTAELPEAIEIEPPTETVAPEDFDPLSAPHAAEKLQRLRDFVARLPETSEGKQFGTPAFKAGKKTFLVVYRHNQRMRLEFWVGAEMQATLTDDPRFVIPRYIGHRGWIDMDIESHIDWDEVRDLALGSYRHFALQRMLKALAKLPDEETRV